MSYEDSLLLKSKDFLLLKITDTQV